MVKGVRAIVAAAALGMGLLGAARAARADATDGNYNFIYTSTSGGPASSSGIFSLSGPNITTVNGVFSDSSSPQSAVFFSFTQTFNNASITLSGSSYLIDAFFYGSNDNDVRFIGQLTYSNGSFSGSVDAHDYANDDNSTGSFTAIAENFVNPVSPSTGGAGASGGAPSPEVNTLLGFLVVGGTVAFMKRRRWGSGAERVAT